MNTSLLEALKAQDAGVHVNGPSDEDGSTALHVAAAHHYTADASAFVELLLDAGADRSIEAAEKRLTALQIAEQRRDLQAQKAVKPGDEEFRNYDAVIDLLRA